VEKVRKVLCTGFRFNSPLTFDANVLRYFSNVCIKKFLPFARCDKCAEFLDTILAATTEEEREEIKEERAAHRQEITVYRISVMARDRMAELHPDTFLALMVDGMDTNKTYIPKEGNTKHRVPHQPAS
jgi:hypothetical protein